MRSSSYLLGARSDAAVDWTFGFRWSDIVVHCQLSVARADTRSAARVYAFLARFVARAALAYARFARRLAISAGESLCRAFFFAAFAAITVLIVAPPAKY